MTDGTDNHEQSERKAPMTDGTDNPAPEAPLPAQNGAAPQRAIEFEDIVGWVQHPLTLLCKGTFASASNLPVEAVILAVATAMGRVLSEGTASDVPAATMAIRSKVEKSFVQSLKMHIPAFRPASMPVMSPLKNH
jgi:hypothetical protein